jgi:hypothetical protein
MLYIECYVVVAGPSPAMQGAKLLPMQAGLSLIMLLMDLPKQSEWARSKKSPSDQSIFGRLRRVCLSFAHPLIDQVVN